MQIIWRYTTMKMRVGVIIVCLSQHTGERPKHMVWILSNKSKGLPLERERHSFESLIPFFHHFSFYSFAPFSPRHILFVFATAEIRVTLGVSQIGRFERIRNVTCLPPSSLSSIVVFL